MRKLFLLIIFLIPCNAYSEYIDLPKDANGWTVFSPSSDSRIVYVAASGNNDTCKYYLPTDPEIGSDPLNPTGSILPCATIGTPGAFPKTRSGSPDWILFKRGDSFSGGVGFAHRSGRSATEPFVVGAYGASGASPILKLTSDNIGIQSNSGRVWLAFFGLDFYSYKRDPVGAEYDPLNIDYNEGVYLYGGSSDSYEGLLIEGCRFRSTNFGMHLAFTTAANGVIIRRNVFTDNYPSTSNAMGVLADEIDGLLFEENVFDKGGWYSKDGSGGVGEGNIYNHNTYVGRVRNVEWRNNVFMRPSNMHNKFVESEGTKSYNINIYNNLYIDGPMGIGIETNNLSIPDRLQDIMIYDNVFTSLGRTDPTGQGIANYIQVAGWKVGSVFNNLIAHAGVPENNGTVIGFDLWTNSDLNIYDNVFHDILGDGYAFKVPATNTNLSITDNIVHNYNSSAILVAKAFTIPLSASTTLSGNKYYYNTSTTGFNTGGSTITLAQWQSDTGDTSVFEQVSFPDSTRSIETYMTSIGDTATIDAFIAKCRTQDRYNWDVECSADAVNDYLRTGFGMTQTATGGSAAMNGSGSTPLSGSGSMTLQ